MPAKLTMTSDLYRNRPVARAYSPWQKRLSVHHAKTVGSAPSRMGTSNTGTMTHHVVQRRLSSAYSVSSRRPPRHSPWMITKDAASATATSVQVAVVTGSWKACDGLNSRAERVTAGIPSSIAPHDGDAARR